jgi:thioredoxin 1
VIARLPGATLDECGFDPYLWDEIEKGNFPMSTHKVTDQSFEAEVLNSDTPVVVDFWAEWCGPCKMIGPSLEELAKEYGPRVKIAKINIDENPHSPSKFGVRSIPTLMVFKGGKVASTKVGAAPKGQLQSWIDGAL